MQICCHLLTKQNGWTCIMVVAAMVVIMRVVVCLQVWWSEEFLYQHQHRPVSSRSIAWSKLFFAWMQAKNCGKVCLGSLHTEKGIWQKILKIGRTKSNRFEWESNRKMRRKIDSNSGNKKVQLENCNHQKVDHRQVQSPVTTIGSNCRHLIILRKSIDWSIRHSIDRMLTSNDDGGGAKGVLKVFSALERQTLFFGLARNEQEVVLSVCWVVILGLV